MKKKIENMDIKEIKAEMIKNERKRVEILDKIKPLEAQITKLYNRNKKLEEQADKMKISNQKDDWNWILSESGNDGMVKYKHRESKLAELGLRSCGYFNDIKQVQVQVALIRNDPASLTQTHKGLKKILKYIKPFKEDFKEIDIFEHTLAEYGTYDLLINEDKKQFYIQKKTYGRPEIIHKFDNLKDVLKVIQEIYYYKETEEAY